MFTGIVEEIGKIKALVRDANSAGLIIEAERVLEDTSIGDSIAVNGLCLTVTEMGGNYFKADIMPESIRRSNLGGLKRGDRVNLERAMAANGRFGGHIVSGHIDGTGIILDMTKEKNAVWVKISADKNIMRYIVEKGSIAIDGVSLTIAEVSQADFSVSLIPHTGEETTLLERKRGYEVNLECDIVGKYIEHFMRFGEKKDITMDFLAETGFI